MLADRVALLRPNPGRLAGIVEVPLPRPRRRDDASSAALKRWLRLMLDGVEAQPDGTAGAQKVGREVMEAQP